MKKTIIYILLLICFIALTSCSSKVNYQIIRRDYIGYLDTDSYIIVEYDSKIISDEIVNEQLTTINNILLNIEASFSKEQTYYMQAASIDKSLLMQINEGLKVTPNDNLKELLTIAQRAHEITKGGFDYSIGTLVNLWNINKQINNDPNTIIIPNQIEITNAINTIGIDHLKQIDNEVFLDNNDTQIDFGAIAKGFASNYISKYLQEYNYQYVAINLGGNIETFGTCITYPNANTVQIRNPFGQENPISIILSSKPMAIVTSGIDMRFIVKDNIIYHHLLDPLTGYPFNNNYESITVICENGGLADALATGFFSLNIDEIFEITKNNSNIQVVIITKDKEIYCSENLQYITNNLEGFIIK